MRFSSFIFLSVILEEASERFAPLYKQDVNRLSILKEYCEVIDELIAVSEAKSFEAEIDEEDMTLCLAVGLAEFIDYQPGNSLFGELVARAMSVEWEYVNDDEMLCRMRFPSIWVRTDRNEVL